MDRARAHLATVNFVMIAYLFISDSPYPFWLVISIATIGVFMLGLFDYLIIFPRELNKTATKNPVMMSIKKDLAEIKSKLERNK
jgi:hypothetical protein